MNFSSSSSSSEVKDLSTEKSNSVKNKRKNFHPKYSATMEENEVSIRPFQHSASPFVSNDKLQEIASTMTELMNIYGLPVSTADIFEIIKRQERNDTGDRGELFENLNSRIFTGYEIKEKQVQ